MFPQLTETQNENVAVWLAALRSGKYKQGKARLARLDADGNYHYCCLGVAIEVCATSKYFDNRTEVLTDAQADELGIDIHGMFKSPVIFEGRPYSSLTGLNDRSICTFSQIADIIEENFRKDNFVRAGRA